MGYQPFSYTQHKTTNLHHYPIHSDKHKRTHQLTKTVTKHHQTPTTIYMHAWKKHVKHI